VGAVTVALSPMTSAIVSRRALPSLMPMATDPSRANAGNAATGASAVSAVAAVGDVAGDVVVLDEAKAAAAGTHPRKTEPRWAAVPKAPEARAAARTPTALTTHSSREAPLRDRATVLTIIART
jgi:hypothetical protein